MAVNDWMANDHLQLNLGKTEVLIIASVYSFLNCTDRYQKPQCFFDPSMNFWKSYQSLISSSEQHWDATQVLEMIHNFTLSGLDYWILFLTA